MNPPLSRFRQRQRSRALPVPGINPPLTRARLRAIELAASSTQADSNVLSSTMSFPAINSNIAQESILPRARALVVANTAGTSSQAGPISRTPTLNGTGARALDLRLNPFTHPDPPSIREADMGTDTFASRTSSAMSTARWTRSRTRLTSLTPDPAQNGSVLRTSRSIPRTAGAARAGTSTDADAGIQTVSPPATTAGSSAAVLIDVDAEMPRGTTVDIAPVVVRRSVIDVDALPSSRHAPFPISKRSRRLGRTERSVVLVASFYCPICMETPRGAFRFEGSSSCVHFLCKMCARQLILSAVDARRIPIRCVQCPESLDIGRCAQMLEDAHPVKHEQLCALAAQHAGISKLAYCSNSKCGMPFDYERGRGDVPTWVRCPMCKVRTCVECRSEWHSGMTCEMFRKRMRDEGDAKLKKLAEENRWKACPKCGSMIERRIGCDHMTCRCGCHFCYRCGKMRHFAHPAVRAAGAQGSSCRC